MSSQGVPIECRSLTKRFDGPAVVDELSFEVAAGTITGFVGANGAGKTTTMRMILGLVARPRARRWSMAAPTETSQIPDRRWARCSTGQAPILLTALEPI